MTLGLQPVTFHYKNDADETAQFGLIAEEVAEVNPTWWYVTKMDNPTQCDMTQSMRCCLTNFSRSITRW
jgi:hypothetical protein